MSNSAQIPLSAAEGVMDEGRVRIRGSTAPARSVVRGECIRNYPLLTDARSSLTVPSNNDVPFCQSASPRHESVEGSAVRVLMLTFDRGSATWIILDGAKRAIQYIEQKVGVLLVQTHRR